MLTVITVSDSHLLPSKYTDYTISGVLNRATNENDSAFLRTHGFCEDFRQIRRKTFYASHELFWFNRRRLFNRFCDKQPKIQINRISLTSLFCVRTFCDKLDKSPTESETDF